MWTWREQTILFYQILSYLDFISSRFYFVQILFHPILSYLVQWFVLFRLFLETLSHDYLLFKVISLMYFMYIYSWWLCFGNCYNVFNLVIYQIASNLMPLRHRNDSMTDVVTCYCLIRYSKLGGFRLNCDLALGSGGHFKGSIPS